jgi:D-psicose/D-tagatose/L-ribulose 3-epimerase
MKLGVNTLIWSAEFNAAQLSLLPPIKAAGFDGVEVPLFNLAEFPTGIIRKGLEANGLECAVCSIVPNGMSLISEDDGVRRRTVQLLQDVIKATAEVGATILCGPLYSPVGYLPGHRRTADEWRRGIDSYRALAPTLAAHGVSMALEPLNRFEAYFLNTTVDAVALCNEVNHPNVGLMIDTFHCNIEEKDIAAAYRLAGPHLKHVQTSENDRGTPGSGHVEWTAVFQALADVGYDGWLTIESFGPRLGEFSAAVAIWRDIEPTPDAIAFDGIKFLRKALAARGR